LVDIGTLFVMVRSGNMHRYETTSHVSSPLR
jgi:hypothetical protein